MRLGRQAGKRRAWGRTLAGSGGDLTAAEQAPEEAGKFAFC